MTAFLTGSVTAAVLATLTFFALQAGTVTMESRFDRPNLHLTNYMTSDMDGE